jgi:putative glutamine amidotransferase
MTARFQMANLATWIRRKDERYFAPFFANHRDVKIFNAARRTVPLQEIDGLLLTGGPDIAPELLRQEVPDLSLIEKDTDAARDKWEFAAVEHTLARSLPLFAICKGMQVLNVALGGTLHLDISGHNLPAQKTHDVQPLRSDRRARHQFQKVNSSHHQAIAKLGDGLEVESWCASDDVIEQVKLRGHPFALAVQYHPERGAIYETLFEDFLSTIENND